MRKLCSWVKKTPQKTKNCKQTRKMRYFFRMSDMEVDTLANMVADKLAVKVPDRVAHMKVNKVADMEVFKMADIVVSRPTRWSLWYWYLDVYVDHLYFQIQVTEKYSTAMCYWYGGLHGGGQHGREGGWNVQNQVYQAWNVLKRSY